MFEFVGVIVAAVVPVIVVFVVGVVFVACMFADRRPNSPRSTSTAQLQPNPATPQLASLPPQDSDLPSFHSAESPSKRP